MKTIKLIGYVLVVSLLTACGGGLPDYDATGTFETTEVLVSSEAAGRLLRLDIEEGSVLQAGAAGRIGGYGSAVI